MHDQIGKTIILLGAIFIVVGIAITFFDRIPLLGKLPGDIHIKRGNLQVYFPLATSIALSVILSLIFWIVSRLARK
jgi:uncharacterized membrane protein SpoIIM required for sporulation